MNNDIIPYEQWNQLLEERLKKYEELYEIIEPDSLEKIGESNEFKYARDYKSLVDLAHGLISAEENWSDEQVEKAQKRIDLVDRFAGMVIGYINHLIFEKCATHHKSK